MELNQYWLDQPLEVSLETMSMCNARCTFCPYTTLERKGEKMPDELIDKLVKEMATFNVPFMFSPFKVNEPLLDKRTLPLLRRMNRDVPLAQLRIFTNGSALTSRNIDEIAALDGVNHLWVSLNAVNADEYKALMGLDFERTADRLDDLHSRHDFPHDVVVSRVGSCSEFAEYCAVRWPRFTPVLIKRDGWLGYVDPENPEIPDTWCGRWWELSITATGIVSLCCMDGSARYPIGDVSKQTMLEVYNSPHWRERREKLMSRKDIFPCSTCTY